MPGEADNLEKWWEEVASEARVERARKAADNPEALEAQLQLFRELDQSTGPVSEKREECNDE